MNTENKHQDPEQEYVADEGASINEEGQQYCEDGECDNVSETEESQSADSEKMAGDADEWRDKYIRLQAEFDNFRKRTLKEKMDLVASAGEDVVKALLPVLDDFDRALAAMESAEDVAAVREGVELICHKLHETLRAKGVSEIEAMGKVLDTDFHEAVAKIPAQKCDCGKIVDVVQKGYMINDKVMRHAKVVVGDK